MVFDSVLMMDLTPVKARKILKHIVQNDSGKIFFVDHAEVRMIERGITRKQAIHCIERGYFIEDPHLSLRNNWEMKLSAAISGNRIEVVCALDNDGEDNFILVITVINKS